MIKRETAYGRDRPITSTLKEQTHSGRGVKVIKIPIEPDTRNGACIKYIS